jgi:hypothetical protein
MFPARKKRPAIPRTRLRFGRREPQRAVLPLEPFGWQTLATMDLSEYDDDEAKGMNLQVPKRSARFDLPEPLDFGVSVSDIVIRNRGREPER